ncbi:MAG TPA: acyltransferase, partial [Chlorobaculum parvum]|nr:acyltransferase [Chlorobaculum parvum]
DDYSGNSLTNPTVPDKYKQLKKAPVHLGRHVLIGSGSVVLPGVSIGVGAAVGALSLVSVPLDEWGIYFGSPAKKIQNRSKKILELDELFKRNER